MEVFKKIELKRAIWGPFSIFFKETFTSGRDKTYNIRRLVRCLIFFEGKWVKENPFLKSRKMRCQLLGLLTEKEE